MSQEELAARRGAILAAARRAFARHGYEGATVRVLEAETGLSRGAIFHHFRDKEALFLALAEDDAARTAEVVAEAGLVQVMRDLRDKDAGWLGVQLMLANGGSCFLPARMAAPFIAAGRLHRVAGSPEYAHPVYMVYPRASDNPVLAQAVSGLRLLAGDTGKT